MSEHSILGKFCLNGDCYISDQAAFDVVDVARHYCENVGYNLAKISSEEENMYAADLIRQTTLDSSFLTSFIGMFFDYLWVCIVCE